MPVAVIDLDGAVRASNEAFDEFFGWDRAEVGELDSRRLRSAVDTSWPDHHLALARAGTVAQPAHHRFRRLNGAPVLANLRTWPFHDESGAVVAMVAGFTAASLDEVDRYRLLWLSLEEQHELMVEWALDGTVLSCNRSCREFFGWPDTVVGRNLDELQMWAEPDNRVLVVGGLMAGVIVERQQRAYDNGRVVEWAETAVRDERGNVRSIFSMGQEVTDRVRVEEALRRSERRNRVMVSNIQDAVVLVDADGRFVDGSAMEHLRLGLGGPDELVGRRLGGLVHPDDEPRARAVFDAILAGSPGATEWCEVRVRTPSGDHSWVELSGVNLLHDPEVEAVVLTVRNVDERKRLEIELDERRREAQEALRQRMALIAQVGHELRNPLQGMVSFVEVLERRSLPDDVAEAVGALAGLVGSMRRVVDDLLDASQLNLGTLRVRSERVDLGPIIDGVVLVARQQAQPGVEIHADPLPADLRWVDGDADRIRQALTNLLSNACRHTASGEVRVAVQAAAAEGQVRVAVLDTGSGVASDDVTRLFRPFERGPQPGADVPGIGLGLAIVAGIASAMGGSSGAAPRAEGGSAFWIDIPRHSAAESAPPPSPRREVPFRRVVLVDDEPVSRLAVEYVLRDLGADVTSLPSAERALAHLADHPADVLVVDVQMPGIDGLELARRVRAGGGVQPLIAVMTGDATDATRAAAAAAGADVFLPKPAGIGDLVDVLTRER